MKRIVALFITSLFIPAFAVENVKDVETLNDSLLKYSHKQVRVEGEIKKKFDDRSFLLKGGGFFTDKDLSNDEIVVVLGQNIKDDQIAKLKAGQNLTVTGSVYGSYLGNSNFVRYFIWDRGHEYEGKPFIVVDEVVVK